MIVTILILISVIFYERKQPISFDDQQSDLRGLYQLAASKSWQSIVSISAKLLSENKILQPDEIRLVNILRFEALFRMKMYDDLNIELNTTLMLYDGVQSSGAEISIELYNFLVSLRMLQSEVKLMTGHSLEALEHLHQTSNWVQTTSFPHTSIQMYWIWQIKCHEVNSNMRSRNWKGSLKLLRNMMLLLESYFPTVSDEEDRELLVKAKIVLLLRSAKLLLQVS